MTKFHSDLTAIAWANKLLTDARIAHLATASRLGRPHVVPICYTYDGKSIFSSIDEKPKRVKPNGLRRILNITENPYICLIVDQYEEDWSKLRYVIVHGMARIIHDGDEHERAVSLLRRKYLQYEAMKLRERPVIKIEPLALTAWKPSNDRED